MTVSKIAAVLMAAGATFATTTLAQAGSIVGLVDGKTLVLIDPMTRKVTGKTEISGAGPLLGIDMRPADGMLYGVAADGWIVTLDPKSGAATPKAKLSEAVKPGVAVTVDFNPVADRLRVMASDGTSLRVNVDDGKAVVDGSHKFKDGDAAAGKTPKVVAGAYTNAMKGATATMLYDLDAATGALVTQAPPNDGVLNTVGPLGVALDGAAAFNIVTMQDRNEAWLVVGGALHTVDLKTGKATTIGKVDGLSGTLGDIAWWD
jgi:hypothetical protein